MNHISTAIETIVLKNPLYYDAVTQGIANFSKLAQLINAEVAELTQKPVQSSTIVVNLTRLARNLKKRDSYLKLCRQSLIDYRINLPIVEFVLDKNEANLKAILRLPQNPSEFFSVAQGQTEINVVCSPFYAKSIESQLTVRHKLANLVLVRIRFQEKLVKTPGLFYYLTGVMFMNGVNIIEAISTYTEFNLLISPPDIQQVTLLLGQLFKPST